MRIFGDHDKRIQLTDPVPDSSTSEPAEASAREFPHSRESLAALRALVDSQKIRGTLRIRRETDSPMLLLAQIWSIEAKFHASIDYALEITGRSLDEVAYTALDTLEQMVP